MLFSDVYLLLSVVIFVVVSSLIIFKAAFKMKKSFSARKLKKLEKYYICNTALYGSQTWYFRKYIRNTREDFKCGARQGWRRSVELRM
jgi:hypothetical protein